MALNLACTSVSPGNLFQVLMSKPHPRQIKSDFLALRPRHHYFQTPLVIPMAAKAANNCLEAKIMIKKQTQEMLETRGNNTDQEMPNPVAAPGP